MIVVDASAWVLSVADSGPAGERARSVLSSDPSWSAPAHGITEVLRTLQRLERAGRLSSEVVDRLAHRISRAEVTYAVPDQASIVAAWGLRHTVSAYDAAYVVLAQRYRVPLVTADLRLAGAAEALGVEVVRLTSDP